MHKIDVPTLKADNLVLRPAVLDDAQFIVGLARDAAIHRMYGGSAASLKQRYTEVEALEWVNNVMEHPCTWVIDVGTVIGTARLDRTDMQDRRASLPSESILPTGWEKALAQK